MSRVVQTVEGKWIVARKYNGKKLAGPFDNAGDAYAALAPRPARKKAEKPA